MFSVAFDKLPISLVFLQKAREMIGSIEFAFKLLCFDLVVADAAPNIEHIGYFCLVYFFLLLFSN